MNSKLTLRELPQQTVVGGLSGKHPVIKFEDRPLSGEVGLHTRFVATLHKHLLRSKISYNFRSIVGIALSHKEFTRRDIEESHTYAVLMIVCTAKEIVLLVLQNIIIESNSRSDKLGDIALHEPVFHRAGVFKLFTDSHTLAGPDEFRQICVEGVMRESGQLHRGGGSVGAAREGDSEDFRGRNSIVGECFVEIANTKEKHRVGVLRLHLDILFHQRSFYELLCHTAVLGN